MESSFIEKVEGLQQLSSIEAVEIEGGLISAGIPELFPTGPYFPNGPCFPRYLVYV